ncbi:MAG: preprotein translocase subunit SecA [Malacoplasma sp.]|nr:preprotein translocase subunit SecA [Malacoplasma sp.]
MKFSKIKKIKKRSKILVKAKLIAQQVENNFDEYQSLSIEDLKIRTDYLIDGLSKNKFTLDDIVVDAFSIAREIIYREYGMLAYQVQMMGAYIVHCGDFAEMYTGEGKSLTLLLVSFLNALTKRGVHIVTVNEYLVERDAKFAEKAFEKLGITVGYNTSKLSKDTKREMFAKDITYTTNSELGFDYLKDNMVRSIEEKVIRELFFVIVDEADSVLIDEARTPLIISGQPKEDFSLYVEIDAFVSELSKEDYKIDDESNTIFLTDSGVEKAEKFFQLDNLYSVENAEVVHKITNALVAHYIFANGKEYLVKDDKIYLVDQFTGRVLEGRSYNAGLQQAIQAKEKVKIEPENVVMATITYQSFFRLYEKLSGVSGTAMTEAEEFLKIYNMVVVRIPTNKPVIRIDKPDYIFGTKKVKWNHVVAEIVNRHETGQPILVGTASVTDSEIIHQRLNELGIDHEVLNARDNTKEAEIIKHAGEKGAITISTNMAGRGTDIKVDDEVRALGGLYVIGTERHESRRIDNQLRGRTGRQGDPGESRFFTSLEDSLFKRFATDRFAKASEKLEDDYYDFGFFSKLLDTTQKKVEGLNFDIRKNLMDYDHVLSLQRELIYKQRDQILLKTSNFAIINNMVNDFVGFQINNFKNADNTSLVDANKLVEFLNEKILKFPYFNTSLFASMPLMLAAEKVVAIIKKIIEVKYNILSQINALNVVDELLLVNLDQKWTKHIDKMTKLREGVNLRSLEQRSPLNIYIEDGNNLFEKMKNEIVFDTVTNLCYLALPNESVELTKALDELVNSDDFKKKDYDNQQKNFDLGLKVADEENEFSSNSNEIIEHQPVSTYKENNAPIIESFVNEDYSDDDSKNQQDFYELSQQDKSDLSISDYELQNGTSSANILESKSDLILKSLEEFTNDDLDPEQTPHVENDDNVFNLETDHLEEEIDAIELLGLNKKEEIETNPAEEQSNMSEQDIEKILEMPAFKNGEQSVSLGEYLDDVLDGMGISNEPDSESEKSDETQEIKEIDNIKQSESNLEIDNETVADEADINQYDENVIQLLDENEKEQIENEIKKSVIFGSSLDSDYEQYRQSVFTKNKTNNIDYEQFKELSDEEIESAIKPFYKLPNVTKRTPGTLFGGNLANKTPFILKNNFDLDSEQKKKKEQYRLENQASVEEMNDLLLLNDEVDRLEKILNKNSKISDDERIELELEHQIETENPVFYLEDIPADANLNEFVAMPNEQTDFDNKIENLEEVLNAEPEENDLASDKEIELDSIDEITDDPIREYILSGLPNLDEENPEVIKSIIKDPLKELKDVELEEREENDESSENSFIDKIKIVPKQFEDNEIIIEEINQELKPDVHNFNKDVIDYLKEKNNK